MTIEEKGFLFRKRFLQVSFGQLLQIRNEYKMLFDSLNEQDIKRLDNMNVFFCRSFSPSCVTHLKNIPSLDNMELIIFDAENIKQMIPEEVVAIILHEIGHVFNPNSDLQQSEFNADDFAISKNYGKYIKSNLIKSIKSQPKVFDNQINKARIERIV